MVALSAHFSHFSPLGFTIRLLQRLSLPIPVLSEHQKIAMGVRGECVKEGPFVSAKQDV